LYRIINDVLSGLGGLLKKKKKDNEISENYHSKFKQDTWKILQPNENLMSLGKLHFIKSHYDWKLVLPDKLKPKDL
jgi:hypothetical protein